MENEKRLIDFDKLVDNFKATALMDCFPGWDDMSHAAKEAVIRFTREYRKIVLNQPIVDAVEVIRCKGCKYWSEGEAGYYDDEGRCTNPSGLDDIANEDDFCSYGERREVE